MGAVKTISMLSVDNPPSLLTSEQPAAPLALLEHCTALQGTPFLALIPDCKHLAFGTNCLRPARTKLLPEDFALLEKRERGTHATPES